MTAERSCTKSGEPHGRPLNVAARRINNSSLFSPSNQPLQPAGASILSAGSGASNGSVTSPLHRSRQGDIQAGRHHQMHMIGHQALCPDA